VKGYLLVVFFCNKMIDNCNNSMLKYNYNNKGEVEYEKGF